MYPWLCRKEEFGSHLDVVHIVVCGPIDVGCMHPQLLPVTSLKPLVCAVVCMRMKLASANMIQSCAGGILCTVVFVPTVMCSTCTY